MTQRRWPDPGLFDPHVCSLAEANETLARSHYLGPIDRGFAWRSGEGVMVFTNPTSRRLPFDRWLELARWCITDGRGSQMWSRFVRWARRTVPEFTTAVSYSDPSVGHTGALYRASGWLWAPTWHRLRPPPSGNGSWDGENVAATKDRWVYPIAADSTRAELLQMDDVAIRRRFPWAEYQEPTWLRGKAQKDGGADYRQFRVGGADSGTPCDQQGGGGANPTSTLTEEAA